MWRESHFYKDQLNLSNFHVHSFQVYSGACPVSRETSCLPVSVSEVISKKQIALQKNKKKNQEKEQTKKNVANQDENIFAIALPPFIPYPAR